MTHQEIVTRMSLIWHSEKSIWELSLSSVYSEIVRRMGQDALNLTATELELAAQEVRAVFEDLGAFQIILILSKKYILAGNFLTVGHFL